MWRGIPAVILLPWLAVGETNFNTPSFPPQQTPAAMKPLSRHPSPRQYEIYTYYSALRQGTREEVAVEATADFVTIAKSPVAGIAPLKLELRPAEGLTFGKLGYPKAYPRAYPRTVNSQSMRMKVARRALIRFTVHADATASLGEHVVKGRLTFQPIRYDSSVGPVQQLDIEIPVRVVARHAEVSKNQWPVPHTPPALIVVMVVLSPVIVPFALLYHAVCGVEGSQRCPD